MSNSTSPEENQTQMASNTKIRLLHLYRLYASGALVTFLIAIDAFPQDPGSYLFSLYFKAANVERRIGQPVPLRLAFDPRITDFDVCLSPKDGFPRNSLFGLRVWLRRPAAAQSSRMAIFRHRLFTDEHFWIAKNPDLNLPWNGSVLAVPSHVQGREHIHPAIIQGVPITFIAKLRESVGIHEYLISLAYDIGGVTRTLCHDIDARITCRINEVSFVIYTIPAKPTATGSTHRLFFWIRTQGVCQRLWKTDTFHMTGLTLPNDFRTDNLILATPDMRNPIQVEMIQEDEPTSAMPVVTQSSIDGHSNNPFTARSKAKSLTASTFSPNASHTIEKRGVYGQGKVPRFNQESRDFARPLEPIHVSMLLTASGAVPEVDDDPVPSYQASSSHQLYRPSLWAHSHTVFPDVEDITGAKGGTGV